MNKIMYIITIIFVALIIGSSCNLIKETISFILPQSAVFDNNTPRQRPRERQQKYENRYQNRREYNRNSSTRQERRQNKMYNSNSDRSYYEYYKNQTNQY